MSFSALARPLFAGVVLTETARHPSDFNNVEDGGGATGIVPYDPALPGYDPTTPMPGEGVKGWGRSDGWLGRSVYEAERLVRYKPGTILLYRVSVTSPIISRLRRPAHTQARGADGYVSSGHSCLSGGCAACLGGGVAPG